MIPAVLSAAGASIRQFGGRKKMENLSFKSNVWCVALASLHLA